MFHAISDLGGAIAVKADGSVVCENLQGEETWTDIKTAVMSGGHAIGLKRDGTVLAIGNNSLGQCDVYDWTDIQAIAAGRGFSVGLKSDGTVITVGDIQNLGWTDIISISANGFNVIGLKKDGSVVTNNKNLNNWSGIVEVCAGSGHYAGICADGTVITSYEKRDDTDAWSNVRVSGRTE